MGYRFNSVRKLWLMLVVLCAVAGADAGVARGQSASGALINPPEWILGEWENSAESDTRRWEQFTFNTHGITLTEGMGNKAVDFSRKYRGYRVKETNGPKTYRVEFYKGKDSLVYEFKLAEADALTEYLKGGLTYSVVRNKRVVRQPITSIQAVLYRRAGAD